ncbi:hypothetical protein PIIN_07979 [Serendipita indica DSM 11827]|uniref:DUF6533 domain-containing protein n=1 Tax=Serendipita indica (strain DSM 11827) TaxID=1109443 RepID=G4TRT2_SERID|nr:hypothetical protein PIIN_07979 [Serendipita indica DSM 11827]
MESQTLVLYDHVLRCIAVAGTTAFFYDYALTLQSEIRFIWASSGGWLGKSVFYYTRYTPVIGLPMALIELFAPDLSTNMCRYFASDAAIQIGLGTRALSIITPLTGSFNGKCTLVGSPPDLSKIIAGSCLSFVPCEIIILVATIVHASQAKNLRSLEGGSAALPILTRLYHDGMAYFGFALVFRLCGSIVWLTAPDPLKPSADYCVYALTSVVTIRFSLRLRESVADSTEVPSELLTTVLKKSFVNPRESRMESSTPPCPCSRS